MANTISYAKEYINNQQEHLNMLNRFLLCSDLIVKKPDIKGKTISYDKMSFANYVMGNYDRATGLSQKDLTFARVDKTLTQDRGDSLSLDILDKQEAQISEGIMGVFNFYNAKVQVPTIDGYCFGKLCEARNGAGFIAKKSAETNLALGLRAFAVLRNKRVKIEECVFYGSVSYLADLENETLGKGLFTIGTWNGRMEAQVKLFKGAKVVEVPDGTLGDDVAFIIAHPMSASVIDVLAGAEYKDNIPNFVGKAQVDVRNYFDAWVEPTGEDGIVVALNKPRALTLSESATHAVVITGVEAGAKVYYKTSAGATSSDTEVVPGADGSYTIATPASTTTFYVVQYLDGTKSDEKSLKITI